MRILSSDVAFNSRHEEQRSESFNRTVNSEQSRATLGEQTGNKVDVVDLSYNARIYSQQYSSVSSHSTVRQGESEIQLQRQQSTISVIQQSIGLHTSIINLSLEEQDTTPLLDPNGTKAYKAVESLDLRSGSAQQTSMTIATQAEQARLVIKEQHVIAESEKLHVGTQGRITTQDGREIDFMMSLEMNRDFKLEESLTIERSQRAMMDPLVINLGGGAASLTSTSFTFDLDADGRTEEISFAGSGSGFLALDVNEDGRINDGSELFGTGSLEGFSDLARYDSDNNMWIDESDPVFEKLKVWSRDEQGNDQLISLKEAGVGAIYLGSTPSSFDLTDSENNLLGQVKRSGIFLTEKGEVASIQELDIAIHNKTSMVEASMQKIEEQSAQWQPAVELPSFDLWGGPTDQFTAQEKPEGYLSLLDMLFPEPGSDLAKKREHAKSEQFEQKGIFNTAELNASRDKEKEEETELYQIDDSTFDMMQRLERKDALKMDQSSDKYEHLRNIIESMQKKHLEQREEMSDKPQTLKSQNV